MNHSEKLLNRLNAIGQALSQRPTARALIGLGSVGTELDRLDDFSDLDFFVIVAPGSKVTYLQDLSWLSDIAPVTYAFLNTRDGYKLLYADGIFCEFAVFEEAELAAIPFVAGRIVWKADGVSDDLATPAPPSNAPTKPTLEWILGEALTNLYVGLMRDQRGEKLSAMRFIQGFAVDRVVQLSARVESAVFAHPDPFSPERRYEQQYPTLAPLLPAMLQGYEKNRQSALAMLTFLDQHFDINPAMKAAIEELCT